MADDNRVILWHHVFEAGNLGIEFVKEGVVRIIQVAQHRMMVLRKGDQIYAMRSQCPHNGFSLEHAAMENGDILCPLHRYRFCIETGKNTSGEGFYLEHFPIEVREGGVYVGVPQRRGISWF